LTTTNEKGPGSRQSKIARADDNRGTSSRASRSGERTGGGKSILSENPYK